VGQVIRFPARRPAAYEAAALDRLLEVVDRRRSLRAGGDGRDIRASRRPATVVPFRLADR
jgi:hypothetical protein